MVSSADLAFAILVSVTVLAKAAGQGSADQGSVYIVHLEKTDAQPDSLEASHNELLSTVFGGSQDKANEAILYSYKNTVNGFAAKLTPEQALELSKKPGVLAVTPQGVAQLHGTQQGAAKAVSGGNAV